MLLYWRMLKLLGIVNNFPSTYVHIILILTVQNGKGSSGNDPKQNDASTDNKGNKLIF